MAASSAGYGWSEMTASRWGRSAGSWIIFGDREFSPNTLAAYGYDLKYLFTFLDREDWQLSCRAMYPGEFPAQ